jgi:ABC-type transporter MlaC component
LSAGSGSRPLMAVLLLAMTGPGAAIDEPGPDATIETAIETFSEAAREYRRQKSADAFAEVASAYVDGHADIEFAAGIIMGEFIGEASADQKRRMAAALKSRVLDGVAGVVLDIDFDELKLEPFPGAVDGYPVFVTVTVPGEAGSRFEFRFRMSRRLGNWRIVDVSAGGRSYVTTKRTEFRLDVINYGLDKAIQRLAPPAAR